MPAKKSICTISCKSNIKQNSTGGYRKVLPFFIILFCSQPSLVFSQGYFQQKVEYTINVTLNDNKHELSAFESLVYTNNSPYELNELYIHLWPNAYKDENTPLAASFYMDGLTTMLNLKEENNGYIDSLDFNVNGEQVKWNLLTDTIDICRIKLNKSLAPGESLTLTTPFHVKIPSATISRLGHLEQAYFITQWYPKPAVFDKNGWNYFSYLDKGEYYGEFGTFDVTITLPENYVVGATGELLGGEKEIAWLTEKALQTEKIIEYSSEMGFPQSSTNSKTLRFKQENIHDFAWFADKRWNVLKGEIKIPGEERTITSWSFFTNVEAKYWKKVPEHINDAIIYFSDWIGPYPYSSVTAVDVTKASGDGMEYPMITAIGSYGDEFEIEETVVHEVGHNWFYGIVGNNERRHPWMDEGLTNFYETRYLYTKHDKDSARQEEVFQKMGKKSRFFGIEKINHRDSQYLSYLMGARKNSDQIPDLSSELFSRPNYPKSVYHKMTLGFDYLSVYLGDSLFDTCIKNYYNEWKYKHPEPKDMKDVFVKTTRKDLDWFFEDLIHTNKKIDYSLTSIKKNKADNTYLLTIKNRKHINAPVPVDAIKNGKVIGTSWQEGFEGKKNISLKCDGCDAFRIDTEGRMPELYRDDNTIKTTGILKRKEDLRMVFPAAFEDPGISQRFYSPIGGWNNYNGFMGGILLHNVFIPEKKFEYVLAPMYAFQTQDIAGGGDLRYNFYPQEGVFQKLSLRSGFSHYAYGTKAAIYTLTEPKALYYSKSDNRLVLQLRNHAPRKQVEQYLTIRHIWIERGLFFNPGTVQDNHFQGEYQRINSNPLEASSVTMQVTGNERYVKATLETKHFINYNSTNKGFRVRFFAGYLNRSSANLLETDYRLRSSGNSGSDDYLFDEVFLGRTESDGILSQQFYNAEGGLKSPTLFYRKASEWMAGLNASTTLPGLIPFRLYAGLCSYNDAKEAYTESNAISYEAGVELPLIKDIFVVYFPLIWSSDIDYVFKQQDWNYGNIIRWELRLTKLNPLELIRKINF